MVTWNKRLTSLNLASRLLFPKCCLPKLATIRSLSGRGDSAENDAIAALVGKFRASASLLELKSYPALWPKRLKRFKARFIVHLVAAANPVAEVHICKSTSPR